MMGPVVYGETASGGAPPADTAVAGGSYGYNGAQGKLTDGNLILMGARPYSPADGRFIQPDPVPGGCANLYTYAYGDPINHPDLSGQDICLGTISADTAIGIAEGTVDIGEALGEIGLDLPIPSPGGLIGAAIGTVVAFNAAYFGAVGVVAKAWAAGQRPLRPLAQGRVAIMLNTYSVFGLFQVPTGAYHLVPYVANGYGVKSHNPCH